MNELSIYSTGLIAGGRVLPNGDDLIVTQTPLPNGITIQGVEFRAMALCQETICTLVPFHNPIAITFQKPIGPVTVNITADLYPDGAIYHFANQL